MSKDATQAGQGDGDDAGAAGQEGDTGTGTDNAGSAGTGTAAAASGTKTRTLTQEELDQMIERRLAKERRDNAGIAEKAQKWDDHVASQATEQEKAEAKAKEREAEIAQREAAANERLLRAVCIEAVREANIDKDFEDLVVDHLMGEGEVTEKGEVEGVAEALKALLKDRPKLVAGEVVKTPPKNGGEFKGGSGAPSVEEQLAELEKQGPAGVRQAIALKLANRGQG